MPEHNDVTTTTAEFPVKRWAKVIVWAVYAQTPRGRYERRVLTNPDVRQAIEKAQREVELWRSPAAIRELVDAAEQVYCWVGPGYPDLDDLEEREKFMADVRKVAWAWSAVAHPVAPRKEGRDQ